MTLYTCNLKDGGDLCLASKNEFLGGRFLRFYTVFLTRFDRGIVERHPRTSLNSDHGHG